MVLLESKNLPLGTIAPEFNLKGVDDERYSLSSFSDFEVLVIVFMCNHCPYVQAVWSRLNKLQSEFFERGVRFIGINPNLNPSYPEESFEKMKEYFAKYEMNFPYLQDADQSVAKAYDAQCTPDIYLFNKSRELFYHGRIDDNWKDESVVTKRELALAIECALSGKGIDFTVSPSIGCSIKWNE